jgi:hypothetical protein
MPPVPKTASTRQRRNKASTNRTLTVVHDVTAPILPPVREWDPQTREWWADIWASPMAPEFDDSDRHGLYLLAVLVDEFWQSPSQSIAAEIRLQRQCYGLTPIDRRRLQWEIDRGDQASESTQRRRAAVAESRAATVVTDDPRHLLA